MSKKTTPPPNFEAWGELKLSCRKEGSGIGHIPVSFRHKKDKLEGKASVSVTQEREKVELDNLKTK